MSTLNKHTAYIIFFVLLKKCLTRIFEKFGECIFLEKKLKKKKLRLRKIDQRKKDGI